MIKALVLSLAVVAVSAQCHQSEQPCDHQPRFQQESNDGQEEYAEPLYSFEYSVIEPKTYDIKSHREQRKGRRGNTEGEYSLVEPDGSRRSVQYHVEGKSGFLAEVHREQGKPSFNEEQPSSRSLYPKPSYHPPSYPSYKPPYHAPSYKPSYHAPSYKPTYYVPSYKPSHY